MLGQVAFQIPQIIRFADLVRHPLCFLHRLVKFPFQSSAEDGAGDSFFRPRPDRCVLIGIPVLSRRCTAHGPIFPGGILSAAEMAFLRI